MEDEKLFKEAIRQWGENAQIGMLIEEMGEVLTALNKMNRNTNGCSTADFVEELVDLEIMINQMKIIFGKHGWDKKRAEKIARLQTRLGV